MENYDDKHELFLKNNKLYWECFYKNDFGNLKEEPGLKMKTAWEVGEKFTDRNELKTHFPCVYNFLVNKKQLKFIIPTKFKNPKSKTLLQMIQESLKYRQS